MDNFLEIANIVPGLIIFPEKKEWPQLHETSLTGLQFPHT